MNPFKKMASIHDTPKFILSFLFIPVYKNVFFLFEELTAGI